ncbi:MAG: hypothetical protein MZW92_30320 [Comamonadaceae bacterium]|nr:hypothetical protein [Comamonadaceae bacterium]
MPPRRSHRRQRSRARERRGRRGYIGARGPDRRQIHRHRARRRPTAHGACLSFAA